MWYRLWIISVVVTAAISGTVADSDTSQAQGLFRRLQERIQSRNPIFRPPPQRAAEEAQQRRSNPSLQGQLSSPQQTFTPGQLSPRVPAQGIQPQRVQPVVPQQPLNPAPDPGRALPPSASADANQLGSSILTPSQRSPAATPQPAPKRPSLGIQVYESQDGIRGLVVDGIRADSLADDAGLQVGDLIVAINGQATPTVADIAAQLEGLQAGDSVRARIVRGRTTSAILIPLRGPNSVQDEAQTRTQQSVASAKPQLAAPKQAQEPAPRKQGQGPAENLGITVDQSPELRGLTVSSIAENSPAAAAGLQVGDRIVSLDGRLLADGQALRRELAARAVGDQLTLQLVRNGALVAADVRLADPTADAGALAQETPLKKGPGKEARGSVLGGLGSAIGDLFGGKPAAKADAGAKKDILELGDDEPVAQAGFESEIEVQPQAKPLNSDPPSLKKLKRPNDDVKDIELTPPLQTDLNEVAKRLREEIRQLEKRLKELEAKK